MSTWIIEWMQARDPTKPYARPRYFGGPTDETRALRNADRFDTADDVEDYRRKHFTPANYRESRVIEVPEAT